MSTSDECRMLIVCHANVCRSPMAEWLARHMFEDRLGAAAGRLEVSSAGTHAEPGWPMHRYTEQVLRERGVTSPGRFRSQPVTAELVARADLVLTADRQQRAFCVGLSPAAVRRTFTLRQFGRQAGALVDPPAPTAAPHERLLALRDLVGVVRGQLPVVPGVEDDLADPVLGPVAGFRICADEVSRVLGVIVDLIAPL